MLATAETDDVAATVALARDQSLPLEDQEVLWQIVRSMVSPDEWAGFAKAAPTSFTPLNCGKPTWRTLHP